MNVWLTGSALIFCILSGSVMADEHVVPNPKLTPGHALPNLTQAEVCAPDFGKKLPVISEELQKKVFAAYGLPHGNRTGYCLSADGCAIDRLIPSSLGGTNDLKNLWVLPYADPAWNVKAKTALEEKLHSLVCSGDLSLNEAQSVIATDWISAYQNLIGEPPDAAANP